MAMPEMNGPALADQLRRMHPQLKVLFVSGDAAAAIRDYRSLPGDAYYLDKPFTAQTLGLKVREILSRSPRDLK
jgi:CheY-like chemotaxis protein